MRLAKRVIAYKTSRMIERAFIVDDDQINQMINRYWLTTRYQLARQVELFANGREALDRYLTLAKTEQTPAVILLDLNMPVMDGWAFLDAFTLVNGDTRVLIVTTSVDASDKQRAQLYPAVVGYIEKPIELDKILPYLDLFTTKP